MFNKLSSPSEFLNFNYQNTMITFTMETYDKTFYDYFEFYSN